MAIHKITQEEFTARRSDERTPLEFIIQEREWYADDAGNLSGVVFLDKTDKDYGFAVLGQTKDGHRWIDGQPSHKTIEEARTRLIAAMSKHEESGQTDFTESDED